MLYKEIIQYVTFEIEFFSKHKALEVLQVVACMISSLSFFVTK